MAFDPFRYDLWITEALRSVVHRALSLAAAEGLSEDHHFYITFHTGAEGVEIPAHIRAAHPHEMTIVLQHQYWDLSVDDEAFEVTLKFKGRDTRLHIPHDAVTAFADPAVSFGLQFKAEDTVAEGEPDAAVGGAATDGDPGGKRQAAGGRQTPEGKVVALNSFRKK